MEKQKLEEWVRIHVKKNSQKQETGHFKTNNLICTSWLTVTSILPGVQKKSSRVFQLFSKNALSRNGKIGSGSNRFLNEDYISIYLNLVKEPREKISVHLK